jgi:sulfur-oxidizing protein SoxY
MEYPRRHFVMKAAGVVAALAAAGWIDPALADSAEWNKRAFDVKSLDELIGLLGGEAASTSEAIHFDAPDIAENGAVVPLAIVSAIPGTESIAILVEKNPNVLAAMFTLPEGTLPEIQARVKMAETCNVYALVRAGGRNFYTAKEIKVTLGGCGG